MEKFLKIKSFLFITFVLVGGIFVSCSDDPNSVGIDTIPKGDQLQTNVYSTLTEKVEQSIVTFQEDSLFWGSSTRLLLGEYKNISSEALISFQVSLPDSILTSLQDNDSTQLINSWIELYPNYWIGDSVNFNFTAHQINTSWNSVKITDDTIANIRASLGPNLLQNYDYSAGDTVIKFDIGNEIVNNWVKRSYDTSYPNDYGILLKPSASGGMVGFQALASYPTSSYPTLFLVFEKLNDFVDTVAVYPGLDIHLTSGDRLLDAANAVYLQGSISVRGRLFFNIDSLPENVLINSANLELFVDDMNSFQGSVKSDTIAASFYHNFAADSIRYDYGKYPILKDGDKYSGDIRQFVQRWVEGESNEGIELKLSDENRSPAAVSLYTGEHPIESLRPRLTIYYTK